MKKLLILFMLFSSLFAAAEISSEVKLQAKVISYDNEFVIVENPKSARFKIPRQDIKNKKMATGEMNTLIMSAKAFKRFMTLHRDSKKN